MCHFHLRTVIMICKSENAAIATSTRTFCRRVQFPLSPRSGLILLALVRATFPLLPTQRSWEKVKWSSLRWNNKWMHHYTACTHTHTPLRSRYTPQRREILRTAVQAIQRRHVLYNVIKSRCSDYSGSSQEFCSAAAAFVTNHEDLHCRVAGLFSEA